LVGWEPWAAEATNDLSGTGAIVVEGCRWRGPGTFAFDLRWDSANSTGLSESATFDVGLQITTGGWGGTVTLSQPGSFTVPLVLPTFAQENVEAARASREQTSTEWASECSVGFESPDQPSVQGGVAVTIDPGSAPVQPSDESPLTIADIAESIDVADIDEPLLPLSRLLALDDVPMVDKLYLLPDRQLDYIEIDEIGGCVRVQSQYDWSDDTRRVALHQTAGCPSSPDGSGQVEVVVNDDDWSIGVSGFGIEGVEEEIVSFVYSADSAAPAAFDADRLLDALVAEREGVAELARFDWTGGRVAAVHGGSNNWGPQFDAIVATPKQARLSQTGVSCRSRSVLLSDNGSGSSHALVFVRGERRAEVDLNDGSPTAISMVPTTLEDWSVGLVDLTGTGIDSVDAIRVLELDGTETPCIQN
jgi:hypothetical protein